MEIPKGNTKEEIRFRDKFIKDFYVGWIAEHPDKRVWNQNLHDYIYVKFISITETCEKAARRYESTMAVMQLTNLLRKAKKVSEVAIKRGTKNQKSFSKMLVMQWRNIKMTVGVQKSTQDKVQYCITAITT